MTILNNPAIGGALARIARVGKRIFTPDGRQVVVQPVNPAPKARVEVVIPLEDLLAGPHIPMKVDGPRRLIAFCGSCQRTIKDLPGHVRVGTHEIRYMLLPDLRPRQESHA